MKFPTPSNSGLVIAFPSSHVLSIEYIDILPALSLTDPKYQQESRDVSNVGTERQRNSTYFLLYIFEKQAQWVTQKPSFKSV